MKRRRGGTEEPISISNVRSASAASSIVTSSSKLTTLLVKELKYHKLTFVNVKTARDLGISHTAGKSRPNTIFKSRANKSKLRVRKIQKLSKIGRGARKLYLGSAFSMSTWGHQACAVSDNEMIALERDAISCTGITPAGRCRTIGLLVAYGVLNTPRARIIRETMRAWFDLLRQATGVPGAINDIRCSWAAAKMHMQNKRYTIKSVRGIMSNIMCILNQAGWIPVAFNCWLSETGATWVIEDFKTSPDIVAASIARAALNKDLVRASRHYNGTGMENGIDVENTLRHVRNIKANSEIPPAYKSMLETIMAGAS